MRSRVAFVVVLMQSLAVQAAPTLEQLRSEVNALNYSQAAKSIELIRATSGLSRAESLEFYLQEGLVKAALKDGSGAKEAFTRALLIDPELKLPGKVAPRVTTPFLEAKGWVKSAGGLALWVEGARLQAGKGWTALVKPLADDKGLVTEAAFTITEDGVSRQQIARPADGLRLEGQGAQVRIEWQLLSVNRWVLAEGSLQLEAPAPPVAVTAAPATVAPVASATPATVIEATRSTAAPFPRFPGVTTLSVGVGAVVTGAIFLATASRNASEARAATTWEGLQRETAVGRTSQTIGGVLVGVGSAAMAGGIVMLIVSGITGSAPANVSVALAPGGLVAVICGAFP